MIIDPGEIYLKKILADSKAKEFSQKLFASTNGIIDDGWNERIIKVSLAKNLNNIDCIVIGSSHVVQISSIRNTGRIGEQCTNLLNLGVSGGSLEDLAIFSYLILNNPNKPQKVFIDITPWILKFEMDSRYAMHQSYYDEMNNVLTEEKSTTVSYNSKIIKNLLNFEYFSTSLLALVNNDQSSNSSLLAKKIFYPHSFNYIDGYTLPVILQDGSRVYSKDFIQAHKLSNSAISSSDEDASYKILGKIYDPKGLKYLEKIINLYLKNGIIVNFIFTPYHPVIFESKSFTPFIHMQAIEKISKNIAKKYKIKIYGSYDPKIVGCTKEEFFDAMHPTTSCLDKINFSK